MPVFVSAGPKTPKPETAAAAAPKPADPVPPPPALQAAATEPPPANDAAAPRDSLPPRVSLPGEDVQQADLVEGRLSAPPVETPKPLVFNFTDEPTGIIYVGTNVDTEKTGKIKINHPDIAKVQFSVYKKKFGEYSIKEYGKSFNGKETSLNGTLLAKDQVLPLRDGDLIGVGSYRCLVSIKDTEVVKEPADEKEEDALTGRLNPDPDKEPPPPVSGYAPTVEQASERNPLKPETPKTASKAPDPALLAAGFLPKLCPMCQDKDKPIHVSEQFCADCGANKDAKLGSAHPTPVNDPPADPPPAAQPPPAIPPATSIKLAGAPAPVQPPKGFVPPPPPPATPPTPPVPPVIPPAPPPKDDPATKAKVHPEADDANKRELDERAKAEGSKPAMVAKNTTEMKREVTKGANKSSLKSLIALISGIGLIVILVFVGKTCQEGGSAVATVASANPSVSETVPVTPLVVEAPTPSVTNAVPPVVAPQPAVCKPFDVALAKKYFEQDNLSDISLDNPKPGMKMRCGVGATMHCVKGKTACDAVKWDVTKGNCTVCENS